MDNRSVEFPTISESDYVGKLVSELDDRPQMLPNELKARFDALGKDVIIPALNAVSKGAEGISERLLATDGTVFRFGVTEDGKYGYVITDEAGADTVIPFSSGGGDATALYEALQYSGLVTEDMTYDEMLDALAKHFPAIYALYMSSANEGKFEAYNGSSGTGYSQFLTKPTVSFSDVMSISFSSGSVKVGCAISELIDLTNYKKIKFHYLATRNGANDNYVRFFVTDTKTQSGMKTYVPSTLIDGSTSVLSKEEDKEIDISALNGKYYIAFELVTSSVSSNVIKISNMYME